MARIVGLDEVGRGCWAGPLVAAAVLLDEPIEGVRDSKKLSKQRREQLDAHIISQAKAYGVGWVTPAEIDAMGLTAAVRLAMLRAMKKLHETTTTYDEIIIDGNIDFFANVKGLFSHTRAVIRADDTFPAVSAASIIAKVARDNYMVEAAKACPQYGFENHVGYGTAAHAAALKVHGVCELHRRSFGPIKQIAGSR